MTNPFIDALTKKYKYKCNGKTVILFDEKTEHVNGNYFCVICEKCSNIPVFHILRKVK